MYSVWSLTHSAYSNGTNPLNRAQDNRVTCFIFGSWIRRSYQGMKPNTVRIVRGSTYDMRA